MPTQFALYGDKLCFGKMLNLIDSGNDLFVCGHAVAGCGALSMLGICGKSMQLLIEEIVNVSRLLCEFLSYVFHSASIAEAKGVRYSGKPGFRRPLSRFSRCPFGRSGVILVEAPL